MSHRAQTFPRAQILQELSLRCQALAANDNRGFKQEFEELDDVGKNLPTRAGDSKANREKNRYPYILPYDHCRVRLSVQNSQPHTDYINANFVPVLCDRYWPLERCTAEHGLIQVTTVTCKQGPDYFITTINLRQRACSTVRIITQYYYPAWPDRGIPKDVSSLCAFTEHVRQELEAIPLLGPAVVHCSAGVGRSGTFVTLLWLMQLCARGIRPDIRAAVEDLRLHR
ncbi:hypothetical protein FQN60_001846, partial [Etheostoma spectabile]